MEVKLIPFNKDEVINKLYTACRTCYLAGTPTEAWEKVEDISEDKKLKLIKHVLDSYHHSVLEHVQLTFLISGVSRSLSHQLVRHRIASYCLSGDTEVYSRNSKINKITLDDLFKRKERLGKANFNIRGMNLNTRELYDMPMTDIVYSGVKPVYIVKTKMGYTIKATKLHRFYIGNNSFKELNDLSVGDTVYVNGIPAYRDKEWLKEHYHVLNESQKHIGELCGVSEHTIRKWVREFGLQKEMGSWTIGVSPVNKGRTKYDYLPLRITSQKMMNNHNSAGYTGSNNPSWAGDNVGESGARRRAKIYTPKVGICSNCGVVSNKTEQHHIDHNPLNYDSSNLIELCVKCHKTYHHKNISVGVPDTIVSIEYFGDVDTYDIEMANEYHNFVANGFIVHNSQQSQRYVEFKDGKFDFVTPKTIAKDSDTNQVFEQVMRYISQAYSNLIKMGVPAEDARAVLPNACTTNITMSVNLRSLIHFTDERCCKCAQDEIYTMANTMAKLVYTELPFLKPYLGPKCEMLGYCPESSQRTCGRKPLKKDVLG